MKILYKIKLFNELYQILHKENQRLVVKCNNYVLLNDKVKVAGIDNFETLDSKSINFCDKYQGNGQFIIKINELINNYLYINNLYM